MYSQVPTLVGVLPLWRFRENNLFVELLRRFHLERLVLHEDPLDLRILGYDIKDFGDIKDFYTKAISASVLLRNLYGAVGLLRHHRICNNLDF